MLKCVKEFGPHLHPSLTELQIHVHVQLVSFGLVWLAIPVWQPMICLSTSANQYH